jgi:hypothetical protein
MATTRASPEDHLWMEVVGRRVLAQLMEEEGMDPLRAMSTMVGMVAALVGSLAPTEKIRDALVAELSETLRELVIDVWEQRMEHEAREAAGTDSQ